MKECYNINDIYQNQIFGVVSKNKIKRMEIVHKWGKWLRKSDFTWIKGTKSLQNLILDNEKKVVECVKQVNSDINDYEAEGFLAIIGIFENKKIIELTNFELKKMKMIILFLSSSDVLIMEDLYEETSDDEKQELNQILIEFSVCKSILITASNIMAIQSICDKIMDLDNG